MSLRLAQPAPDFSVVDQFGQDVALSRLTESTHVLLVFFPFAFSSVCTGELDELQAALPRFHDAGVIVAGVSCDPMFSLRAYAEDRDYTFPLLSDFWPHGAVSTAFGVFNTDHGRAERGSFLVEQGGLLSWQLVHPVQSARPLSAYLEAVAELPALPE